MKIDVEGNAIIRLERALQRYRDALAKVGQKISSGSFIDKDDSDFIELDLADEEMSRAKEDMRSIANEIRCGKR